MNGSEIACALPVKEPFDFTVYQKSGAFTRCNTEDIDIETRSGKGQPVILVVMDDFVEKLVCDRSFGRRGNRSRRLCLRKFPQMDGKGLQRKENIVIMYLHYGGNLYNRSFAGKETRNDPNGSWPRLAETLGHFQPHEHLFVHPTPASKKSPALEISSEEKSLAELLEYRQKGGGAIADAQPLGAGRDAGVPFAS